MKRRPFYECKIYVGSVASEINVNKWNNEVFTQSQIESCCGEIQRAYDYIIPIRITPTTFISDIDYCENGWEIAAIDYPKLPYNKRQIKRWMRSLAETLLMRFKQHTICVIDKDEIIMLENEHIT